MFNVVCDNKTALHFADEELGHYSQPIFG